MSKPLKPIPADPALLGCYGVAQKQLQILRLAALAQDDSICETNFWLGTLDVSQTKEGKICR
jgi:hypothetical protein